MQLVSKCLIVLFLCLMVCFLGSFSVGAAPPPTQPNTPAGQSKPYKGLLSLLPKNVQQQCGLTKLSDEELARLNGVVAVLISSSNQAAQLSKGYLESQGWQEVEVLGRTTVKEGQWDYVGTDVVVIRGLGIGRKYFTGSGLGGLAKGTTMANGFRRIEILDTSGLSLSLRQVDVEE